MPAAGLKTVATARVSSKTIHPYHPRPRPRSHTCPRPRPRLRNPPYNLQRCRQLTHDSFFPTTQNGVGAFILQCKRLDLHYCDWAGSSRGMNSFLTSPLLSRLSTTYPQTEIRVSPRPGRHPVLRATYINGREKAVCVRNLRKDEIWDKVQFLLANSGKKNVRIGTKKVLSTNENVRGIWSPMHGGIKPI